MKSAYRARVIRAFRAASRDVHPRLWLVAVIVSTAGLGLRLVAFNRRELWLDETWTGTAAFGQTLPGLFTHWVLPDVHPPAYPLLMLVWVKLFGVSNAALRIPSLAAALAMPFAAFWGLRASIGPREGVVAGALLAICSTLILYADWARVYSVLALACLLASMAALRVARGQPGGWTFFVTIGLFACFLHYFGALLVAGLSLGLFGLHLARGQLVLRPFLLIAAGFLPWVAIHARSLHAKSGGRFWIEPMGFGDALQTALLATFGGTFREVLLFLSPVVLLLLSPIGDFGRLGRMAMATLALLAMLDLAVAVISLQTPLTVPRYFLAFLPTGLLAASVIAARLSTVLLAAWLALCGTVSLTTAASALFPLSVAGYPAWEHHSTFLAQGGIRSLIFYLDDPLNPSLDPRRLEELGGFFLRRAGRDLPVLAVSLRPGATNLQEKSSLPRPTGIIKVSSGLLSYQEDREWLVRLTENWPDTACDGDPYQDKSVACIMY